MTKEQLEKEIRLLKDQLAEALFEKNRWRHKYWRLALRVEQAMEVIDDEDN